MGVRRDVLLIIFCVFAFQKFECRSFRMSWLIVKMKLAITLFNKFGRLSKLFILVLQISVIQSVAGYLSGTAHTLILEISSFKDIVFNAAKFLFSYRKS